MEAVAGHPGAVQPVGQLPGEEHVAELAVAVRAQGVQRRRPAPQQVLLRRQQGAVDGAQAVEQRRHGDHAARGAPPEPLQQEVCEEEMPEVVDAKRHAKAVLRVPRTHHPFRVKGPRC